MRKLTSVTEYLAVRAVLRTSSNALRQVTTSMEPDAGSSSALDE